MRCLSLSIDSGFDMAELPGRRIYESMAQPNVPRRRDSQQAQSGPAGVGLAYSLMRLLKRVAHIRETVMPVLQSIPQVFIRQLRELVQDMIQSTAADGIEPHRRGRYRRKANFVKTHLFSQVPENLLDIDNLGRQRHPGPDWTRPVNLDQLLDLWSDHVIGAPAIMKNAEAVI